MYFGLNACFVIFLVYTKTAPSLGAVLYWRLLRVFLLVEPIKLEEVNDAVHDERSRDKCNR